MNNDTGSTCILNLFFFFFFFQSYRADFLLSFFFLESKYIRNRIVFVELFEIFFEILVFDNEKEINSINLNLSPAEFDNFERMKERREFIFNYLLYELGR